jgi:hypothetical protein
MFVRDGNMPLSACILSQVPIPSILSAVAQAVFRQRQNSESILYLPLHPSHI